MSDGHSRPTHFEAASRCLGSGQLLDALPHTGASYQVQHFSNSCSIGEAIRDQAERRSDEPAIIASRFQPLSYRDLQKQIHTIGSRLREAGFDRNARIAIALPDGPEAALAIVGIACAAVAIPFNSRLTVPEFDRRLTLLRPNAMILVRGSPSAARIVAERHGIAIVETSLGEAGKLALDPVVQKIGPAVLADKTDADAPAFILESSGTTSDPKFIPYSHRNMLTAAERLRAWFGLTPEDRCLSVSPVYHGRGLKVSVFTPLLTGGSVAFPIDASSLNPSEWLEALRPTWYKAGPTVHLAMFEKARAQPKTKNMHSLRFILSGSASLPTNVREGLQAALEVPVLEVYACSEAGQVASNLPPPSPSKPGTCGIPWPQSVIIAGENGRCLPQGQRGEVLVGGPTVTSGYLDAPDLNRTAFIDGWFRTGDIGSLDEEGFLTIHGRLAEVINRGGQKIAPPEIEHALMLHPEVAEAAAFAVPHPRLGEDVGAAIVLRAGSTITPTDLRMFLNDQLAPFKIPRRIVVLDQLPKGASGKVQRLQLSKKLSKEEKNKSQEADELNGNLQSELLQLWTRLLGTTDITVDDDFFLKGADSVLATELLIEIEKLTGRALEASILSEPVTVRTLAERLSRLAEVQVSPAIEMMPSGG